MTWTSKYNYHSYQKPILPIRIVKHKNYLVPNAFPARSWKWGILKIGHLTKMGQKAFFFFFFFKCPIATSPLMVLCQNWSHFCCKPYGWEVENWYFPDSNDMKNSIFWGLKWPNLPISAQNCEFLQFFTEIRPLRIVTQSFGPFWSFSLKL